MKTAEESKASLEAGANKRLIIPSLTFTSFVTGTPGILTGLLLIDIGMTLRSPRGDHGSDAHSFIHRRFHLRPPRWSLECPLQAQEPAVVRTVLFPCISYRMRILPELPDDASILSPDGIRHVLDRNNGHDAYRRILFPRE